MYCVCYVMLYHLITLCACSVRGYLVDCSRTFDYIIHLCIYILYVHVKNKFSY